MNRAVRQILALAVGAGVIGGVLIAGDLSRARVDGLVVSKSDCPSPAGDAPDNSEQPAPKPAPMSPLRLAKVTLPPPPQRLTAKTRDRDPPTQKLPATERVVARPSPAKTKAEASGTGGLALSAGRVLEAAGRPLLRLLEHGEGPVVEITWPEHRVARARLYGVLQRCHGLRTALLRDAEILLSTDPADRFDSDRHSGFLRMIQGPSPRAERGVLKALRAGHAAPDAAAIRLLSRQFDARLLGGLRRLVGAGYRGARSVKARYAVAGQRVMVHGVTVDGKARAGRIEIEPTGHCAGAGA